MARKFNERYVRYYTPGNTTGKNPGSGKEPATPERKTIEVEPIALVGNAVALLLAVLMIVGLLQVNQINTQVRDMEVYVLGLERIEANLEAEYRNSYDLEEVRLAAESMGMIPAQEALRVPVRVPEEQVEVIQLSWWENFLVSLRRIFA